MNNQESVNGEVVYEEITDARNGEIIPKGSPPELKPGILAQININQVGTLEVGEDALKVLEEPLDPNDVKIRPDGLVYLPWTWYNKRLNRAFGVFKWGQIPQGSPMFTEQGNSILVVWLQWLVVKGIPVSMAGGETSYNPSNFTMSKGDAIEGAKSNALARNCKYLGMALELWDADWVAEWKKKYAETYKNEKGKTVWRKRGNKNGETEQSQPAESIKAEKPEEVKATPEEVKSETGTDGVVKYKVNDLRSFEMVKKIKALAQVKKDSEVVKVICELDPKLSYSIADVVSLLKPKEEEHA